MQQKVDAAKIHSTITIAKIMLSNLKLPTHTTTSPHPQFSPSATKDKMEWAVSIVTVQ